MKDERERYLNRVPAVEALALIGRNKENALIVIAAKMKRRNLMDRNM